jgi:hypothetical protein
MVAKKEQEKKYTDRDEAQRAGQASGWFAAVTVKDASR